MAVFYGLPYNLVKYTEKIMKATYLAGQNATNNPRGFTQDAHAIIKNKSHARVCRSGANPTIRIVGLTPNLQPRARGFTLIELLLANIGQVKPDVSRKVAGKLSGSRLTYNDCELASWRKRAQMWKMVAGVQTQHHRSVVRNITGMSFATSPGKIASRLIFQIWDDFSPQVERGVRLPDGA